MDDSTASESPSSNALISDPHAPSGTSTHSTIDKKLDQKPNAPNANAEYSQIKFDFLKLLKQFKIFEFDRFMKWLGNLVDDYEQIGYNVIGN